MVLSGRHGDPDERSALLRDETGDTVNGSKSGHRDGIANGNGSYGTQAAQDEEVEAGAGAGEGEGEEVASSLIEGDRTMADKMYLLFPAVSIGVFLSAADQTIIVSSYGRIGSDLKALNNTSWIATAYFLTLTTFQPLYGKLSDIFGRKPCLIFAYSVFGLGCLFCGLARNLEELVAARAFAGIGGGGMTTVVSILLSDIVPLRNRGTWQGYVNIIYALGASAGAPLGGLLSDSIGWRWAFIGQFPMTFVASIAVYFVLDLPKKDHSHWLEKLRRIDFLGAFCLVLAVFSVLFGLDRGSNVAWNDKITIATCCISAPLFALFVLVEVYVASHPFAPGHIIFQRSLLASYLCNFFALSAHMGIIFYIPLYLQAVEGMSATSAGLRLIPPMICSVSGSLFAGRFMQWTGRYYWLTVSAMFISAIGGVGIFLSAGLVFDSAWGMIIALCFCSFGGGAAIVSTLINVIANADAKDQAIATACTYLFRSLGSVIGVSLSATVVQQSLRTQLRESLKNGKAAEKIVEHVRQSLDYIKELEPHTRDIVRHCYQRATDAAFGMSIGIICCSLISASFIREKKLSK